MKTILVCTDFSDGSKNAENYAAALCQSTGASLLLTHIYFEEEENTDDTLKEEKKATLHNQLDRNAVEMKSKFGIAIQPVLRSGKPIDEITAVAKEMAVDLVVTGARETAAGSGLVGGLVYDLMHSSLFPVLAVPEACEFVAYKEILFAVNPSGLLPYNDKALKSLIDSFKSNLNIVTIAAANAHDAEGKPRGLSMLQSMYTSIPHQFVHLQNSSFPNGIQDAVKLHKTDLLTIISQRSNFLDRMLKNTNTQKVFYSTTIPMLTIPEVL
jgi:nucleotide-binding universal stress UspA family protein